MEIIFTNTRDFVLDGFEPVPARKIIPEWYKNLPSYMNEDNKKIPTGDGSTSQTAKKCMPLFDVVGMGYIISTYVDVYVSIKDGAHWYEWPSFDPINFHPYKQAESHPQSYKQDFPKWLNPWSIKTSKGTSCLFIPPVHRESSFSVLEGVVDTDTYDNNINFPFVMKDPTFEGLIPAGTPMVQVIPFQREDWKMKIGGELEKNEALKTQFRIRQTFFDGYKNNYRKTKDYL